MRGALFIMRISREIFNEGKSSPVLKIKNAYAKGLTVAHDELRSYSHNVWKKNQTNKQTKMPPLSKPGGLLPCQLLGT